MFSKYVGKFRKAEAEWVLEVIDMCDGDEPAARAKVAASIQQIIARRQAAEEVTDEFDQLVEAACFSSRHWWGIGLAKLRELGVFPIASATARGTV